MRTDTLNRVADALGTGSRSITDISRKTGLSYNSVKAALPKLGAIKVEGSSPSLWHLPKKSRDLTREARPSIEIEITEHDDWPDRWNKARRKFGTEIGSIEIDPRANPTELLDAFRRAATSLASIVAALEEHHDKPDWYTLLGGVLEPDDPTK